MAFYFGVAPDQFMSMTYANEFSGRSFEEWRWEFYNVFNHDVKEEKDGHLVEDYLKTMRFRSVPIATSGKAYEETYRTYNFNSSSEENDDHETTTECTKEVILTDFYKPMFNNALYSDFTIRFMIQGHEVNSLHVHKVVLAEHSDYFRNMFSLGMIESNSNELIVDLEEEKEYAFCRMIQAIYDPTLLSKDFIVNYELILLFDKYGFDGHKRTLVRNILASCDISFFNYLTNNLFLYEIIVSTFPNEILQAISNNPSLLLYSQDIASDLFMRYAKQSQLSNFQWKTVGIFNSIVKDQKLKDECMVIIHRKFSQIRNGSYVQ